MARYVSRDTTKTVDAVRFDGDDAWSDDPARLDWLPDVQNIGAPLRHPHHALAQAEIWVCRDTSTAPQRVGDRLLVRAPARQFSVIPGEWIVRDAAGDLSVCNPHDFAETYGPAAP